MKNVETVSFESKSIFETIYNLNVEDNHTFFVGSQRLLVHNDCFTDMTNAFDVAVQDAIASGVTNLAELQAYGKAAARELIEGFKWGDYLKSMIGNPPPNMVKPHAHHILFKEGFGEAQKKLVREGQQILSSYGIDPIKGVENLVWAPNIKGQHITVTIERVVSELRNIKEMNGTKAQIINKLKQLGQEAASIT